MFQVYPDWAWPQLQRLWARMQATLTGEPLPLAASESTASGMLAEPPIALSENAGVVETAAAASSVLQRAIGMAKPPTAPKRRDSVRAQVAALQGAVGMARSPSNPASAKAAATAALREAAGLNAPTVEDSVAAALQGALGLRQEGGDSRVEETAASALRSAMGIDPPLEAFVENTPPSAARDSASAALARAAGLVAAPAPADGNPIASALRRAAGIEPPEPVLDFDISALLGDRTGGATAPLQSSSVFVPVAGGDVEPAGAFPTIDLDAVADTDAVMVDDPYADEDFGDAGGGDFPSFNVDGDAVVGDEESGRAASLLSLQLAGAGGRAALTVAQPAQPVAASASGGATITTEEPKKSAGRSRVPTAARSPVKGKIEPTRAAARKDSASSARPATGVAAKGTPVERRAPVTAPSKSAKSDARPAIPPAAAALVLAGDAGQKRPDVPSIDKEAFRALLKRLEEQALSGRLPAAKSVKTEPPVAAASATKHAERIRKANERKLALRQGRQRPVSSVAVLAAPIAATTAIVQ